MAINIIDRQFNFLGQIDDYKSLIFTKNYSSIGSFELHVNENTNNADRLIKENIIFTTNKKVYVILHRELNSVDGSVMIKGKEIKSYLARLITLPPTGYAYHRVNNNAETIMKEYVSHNLSERNIIEIEVAPNKHRGDNLVYQTRYKNLGEELEKISLASGLGWDITLDVENKKFIFDVYEGRNLTSCQDDLPPAIFSIDYDNISSQKLIDSNINYRNVAYIGGQGEGANRAIEVIGDEAEGLDRHEVFIDARDIEDDTSLADRGLQKLKEYREIITLDNEILTQSNLVYETDFDLGDIVTAVNRKWDITLDSRITEITEVYESNGFKVNAVFGNNIPTLIDKIKQEIDSPLIEKNLIENGEPGADGVGLNFTWNDTELGVKREDEVNYTYTNLVGPKGDKGDKGDTGPQGERGPQGVQGPIGEKGDVGLIGPVGPKGDTGYSAYQVWLNQGNIGTIQDYLASLKGEKGDKGDQGIQGTQGPIGLTGAKGDKGDQGERGLQGIQGEVGPQGPKGDDGYTPVKGIDYFDGTKGDKGDTGPIGPQGPQGEPGPQGPAGSSTWEDISNKPTAFPPSNHSHNELDSKPTYNINDTTLPSEINIAGGLRLDFINNFSGGGSGYRTILTLTGYNNNGLTQLAFNYNSNAPDVYIRISNYTTNTWSHWTLLGGSGGMQIISSATEPSSLSTGDQWHKEI